MLVAVPRGALVAQNGQKWPEMALHLTNYCLWPFRIFLLTMPGLDGLAALSHSAGPAVRYCRRAKFPGVGISFRRDSKRSVLRPWLHEKALLFESRRNGSVARLKCDEPSTGQTVNVNGANPSLRRNPAKQGVFSLFRIAREKLCPRLVPTEPRVPGFPCARCAQQP